MTSQVLSSQTSVAVFSRLLRANSTLSRELSARLITEHGLTINDYEALLHLSRAEDGRMSLLGSEEQAESGYGLDRDHMSPWSEVRGRTQFRPEISLGQGSFKEVQTRRRS